MSAHENDAEGHVPIVPEFPEGAYQACYVFRPIHQDAEDLDDRPRKRQKTSKPQVRDDAPRFPRLLDGEESAASTSRREKIFNYAWALQQAKIDEIVGRVDEVATKKILTFIEDNERIDDGKVPTGLLVGGRHGNVQERLEKMLQQDQRVGSECVVQLDSSQAPNLQTALKNIIKTAVSNVAGHEGYQDLLTKHKRLIPMNFDLELLQLFTKDRNISKIVLSLSEVETFDLSVLSDLVSSLSSWSDRFHFVLLLSLATTVELFEARLSTSTIRLLRAKVFDLSSSRDINYEIFRAVQTNPDSKLWLGPIACGVLVEMTKDQDTTPESFCRAIKYAFMSHFFANSLSILLAEADPGSEETEALFEAIRNTESFQKHAENLLTKGKAGAQAVRRLLNDDDYLLSAAYKAITEGQQKMIKTFQAIDAFKELPILLVLQPPANASAFDIDMVALNGPDFIASDPYISIMLILEKVRSDHLLHILGHFSLRTNDTDYTESQTPKAPTFKSIFEALQAFQSENDNKSIRSAYDPSHPSHATTLSNAGRVGITKKTAKLTPAESVYTDIMNNLLAALESYFDTHITKAAPTTLFMNEAFVYDLKTPLSGAFAPSPRHAIERALGRPGDYLGCRCCATAEEEVKHDKMPATSLLWKLWCEASGLVNIRDLWEAFRATFVGDDEEVVEESDKMNERLALALFYRGLAELKMLGLVKASKRKPGVECLAKTSWAGL